MKVVIIGGGGHAKVIIDILRLNKIKIYGIYDDHLKKGTTINGIKVRGKISSLPTSKPRLKYICAIGNNQNRQKIVESIDSNLEWINAIHPTAWISDQAVTLGIGLTICAGAIIQTNTTIGDHSIINTKTSIDHDCQIGNFTHLAPGSTICGVVEIGNGTMIGAGSTIIQCRKIGENSLIGAGSNVIKDIPANVTAFGNPCQLVKSKVVQKWPVFEPNEIKAAVDVLKSGKVNQWTGSKVKQFEKDFANYVGTKHAIALANGTLAIELALYAIGLQPGDEVIVTPRSFIASASSITICGGTPIFADIDPDSQNITAETIKAKITPKTKAVICVHLAGWPCQMDQINQLCQKQKIYVIEDCAQAHGARYQDKSVGSLSDIACWSFCQDKIMTTGGEGGMITLDNTDLYKKAWSYKDHGKDYDMIFNPDPNAPAGYRRIYTTFGTNWRLTEMQAAIGIEMLKRLDSMVKTRRANAEYLIERLSKLDHLRLPVPEANIYHSYYRFYFFISDQELRDQVIETVQQKDLPCFTGSCSELYLEKAFDQLGNFETLPNSHQLGNESVALLVDTTVQANTLAQICDIIESKMN